MPVLSGTCKSTSNSSPSSFQVYLSSSRCHDGMFKLIWDCLCPSLTAYCQHSYIKRLGSELHKGSKRMLEDSAGKSSGKRCAATPNLCAFLCCFAAARQLVASRRPTLQDPKQTIPTHTLSTKQTITTEHLVWIWKPRILAL